MKGTYEEAEARFELNLEYMRAAIRVAAVARLFVIAADDAPLIGMNADQGFLWDELADAISVLEEMEAAA